MSKGTSMSILTNGFGIISFISVTPLIAIQMLGIIYDVRLRKAQSEAMEDSLEDLQSLVSERVDSSTTNNESEGTASE